MSLVHWSHYCGIQCIPLLQRSLSPLILFFLYTNVLLLLWFLLTFAIRELFSPISQVKRAKKRQNHSVPSSMSLRLTCLVSSWHSVSINILKIFFVKLVRNRGYVVKRFCAHKMSYHILWIQQIVVNSQKLVKRRLLEKELCFCWLVLDDQWSLIYNMPFYYYQFYEDSEYLIFVLFISPVKFVVIFFCVSKCLVVRWMKKKFTQ